jgi:antitoxin component YwqK of YwqJK toxin-antitoxin module
MKTKLFIPRKLSINDSRYSEWNNQQPYVDGVQINQYNYDGKKIGYWEESKFGIIESKYCVTYDNNGILNGKCMSYDRNGNIEYKGQFINGEMDGEWIDYSQNGNVRTIGKYKNSEMEGEWISYNNDGTILFTYNHIIK